MRRTGCLLVTLLVFVVQVAFADQTSRPSAFDGQRRGFVLGIGAGYVPVVVIESGHNYDGKRGLGFHLLIGHGWDNNNLTFMEFNTAIYEGRGIGWCGTTSGPDGRANVGISWYHYYDKLKPTSLTVLGFGRYYRSNHDPELGILTGAGIEFIRHFQLTGYVLVGHPLKRGGGFSISHISVLLTALAY